MFCCVVNEGDEMPAFTDKKNKQLYIVLQHGLDWGAKYLYSWDPNNTNTKYMGGWPGAKEEAIIKLYDDNKTYVYWTIPRDANDVPINVVFNNNKGGEPNQTDDTVISNFNRDYCYYLIRSSPKQKADEIPLL